MAQLLNTAHVAGTWQTMDVTADTELVVDLSAISVVKSADKLIWVDEDTLTYTLVVTNLDDRDPDDPTDPGYPVTGITITDQIDTDIATFVDGTLIVTLSPDPTPLPNPTYNYDPDTGVLTVQLDELAPGQVANITFQVDKV